MEKRLVYVWSVGFAAKKTLCGVCAAWYRCRRLTQPYETVGCAKEKAENEQEKATFQASEAVLCF